MPAGPDWRTVRRMRALRLVRDHADTAFAVFCTVAMQIEVWFAGYSPHRPLLSLLALFATVPLAFRCVYPLASYTVIWLAIFAIVNLAPGFDDQSVIFVVVFVFALYSLGANARGRQAWGAAVLVPFAITAFGGSAIWFLSAYWPPGCGRSMTVFPAASIPSQKSSNV